MSKRSELEEQAALGILALGFPQPEREYKFLADRRFRFDFAWPDRKVALEIEGGVWINGRHNRGAGFIADCEKYSLAASHGWRVLRAAGKHIESGAVYDWLESALNAQTKSD